MIRYNDEINPGDVIALGDVHGQTELFEQFLSWVEDSRARVILLGDLVDRAKNPGDDLKVLSRVQELYNKPENSGLSSFTVIQGNHERFLINAIDGYGYSDWVRNGGDWENLADMVKYRDFLDSLPYYLIIDDTLFSHAGVPVGRNPEVMMGTPTLREQFVWQREPFLTLGPQLEKWTTVLKKVVHGHTPTYFEKGVEGFEKEQKVCTPVVKKDRVNIDTGACFVDGGCLTAYNVTQNTFKQFLHTV